MSDIERVSGSVDRVVFGIAMPPLRSHHVAQPALLRADLTAMLRSGARNIELQPGQHSLQMGGIGKVFGTAVLE